MHFGYKLENLRHSLLHDANVTSYVPFKLDNTVRQWYNTVTINQRKRITI